MPIALVLLLLDQATVGDSLQKLLGGPSRAYIAPGRVYALSVPSGWDVLQASDNPDEVQLAPSSGVGDAVMFVRRVDIPEGADPMQLALRAIDLRLSKMPRFQLSVKRRVKLAGHPAATLSGTYALQGNLQWPRVIEEVYVVVGGEGFVFHFECGQPVAHTYVEAVSSVYESFIPRPAEDALEPKRPNLDNIPF